MINHCNSVTHFKEFRNLLDICFLPISSLSLFQSDYSPLLLLYPQPGMLSPPRPPSLPFCLFFRLPHPLRASGDSPIGCLHHRFTVSFLHSFTEWIFQWCVVECQYGILHLCLCVHAHWKYHLLSLAQEIQRWKSRLFSVLLLSIAPHNLARLLLVGI